MTMDKKTYQRLNRRYHQNERELIETRYQASMVEDEIELLIRKRRSLTIAIDDLESKEIKLFNKMTAEPVQ